MIRLKQRGKIGGLDRTGRQFREWAVPASIAAAKGHRRKRQFKRSPHQRRKMGMPR